MACGRAALKRQWDKGQKAFICDYTGLRLTLDGGARDAEWEHPDPKNDPTNVVLVAAVVNRMKADMNIREWDAMIRALYQYRIDAVRPFNKKALPLNWQPKSSAHKRTRRSAKHDPVLDEVDP